MISGASASSSTRCSGGGQGARRGGVRVSFPGNDIEVQLPVTLEDLLRGGRRRLGLDRGRSIDVESPLGAHDGTVLRLAGQGEPGVNGGPPGDLYLHLRLIPHPRYRVVGEDLEMNLPLWPWQAVLGGEVQVETPDGPVTLRVPPGTQSGRRRLRLRGRGLPRRGGGRGDLHAVARIVVPARPSAEGARGTKHCGAAPTSPPTGQRSCETPMRPPLRTSGMPIGAWPPDNRLHLSSDELAAAGISPARLARLIRLGVVEPDSPGALGYSAASVLRLRRMLRLHADLRTNFIGAAIAVDLLERLERLDAELAQWRRPRGGGNAG